MHFNSLARNGENLISGLENGLVELHKDKYTVSSSFRLKGRAVFFVK